jgi:putative RNA 2'-phosphotransferase
MNEKRRTELSKFLSYVLRHKPDAIGIELADDGWIDVDVLLAACRAHKKAIAREVLEEIVRTSPKQRFAFSDDGTKIRASQGHSVAVVLGYDAVEPPEYLFHGTAEKLVDAIRREGLKRMARHHVHLSPDRTTAHQVGQRKGRVVTFRVAAGRMHADGHEFFCSENGVWLTDRVPPEYLDLVE